MKMARRKHKCCKDYYCGFPAWTGTSCIFCGAKCSNCDVPKETEKQQDT